MRPSLRLLRCAGNNNAGSTTPSKSVASTSQYYPKRLPVDIVLVRHGESEGNYAQMHAKAGDDRYWTPEFAERHTSRYRLTDRGRRQAQLAGKFIRENISTHFDAYYTSEYVRARETAAHLRLPGAIWFSEFYLRERDKGILASKTPKQREEHHKSGLLDHFVLNPFYGAPPGGESIAEVCLRVDWVMAIWRAIEAQKLIAVCHGNIMMAFRLRIERLSQDQFHAIDQSKHPFDKLHHCQILQYSRRNPDTGDIVDFPLWMRSICPWDTSLSSNKWTQIDRPVYSNDDLLHEVEKVKQLINSTPEEEAQMFNNKSHEA